MHKTLTRGDALAVIYLCTTQNYVEATTRIAFVAEVGQRHSGFVAGGFRRKPNRAADTPEWVDIGIVPTIADEMG